MQRIISTVILCGFMVLTLRAQPVKKVETIKEEEVPVLIRKAFISDFGPIPKEGTWSVNFLVIHEGARTSAQPTQYTFRKGKKQDRIEVRYSADGRLESARGLKTTESNT